MTYIVVITDDSGNAEARVIKPLHITLAPVHKEDTNHCRSYERGWNDAMDYIINGEGEE